MIPFNQLLKQHFAFFVVLILALSITSCSKQAENDVTPPPVSPPKENLPPVFNIKKADSTLFDADDINITTVNDSVKVTLPATTDINKLIADIKVDNATITPLPGSIQSFDKPVAFTIKTSDGKTTTYVISIKLDKLKNVVYFGTLKSLYALNAKKGTLIWEYKSGTNFSYSTPTIVNGILYTTNTDHNLYALDPLSGKLKWKFATNSTTISSPAVVNGIVYFTSDDYNIYAVDATSGILKWKYRTGYNVDSSPVVANGLVYAGGSDNYLYALDALTGNLVWKYYTSNIMVEASAIVSNGLVFVGNRSGDFYALNATNGQLKWSFGTNGISFEQSRPVINNGVIFVASGYDFKNNKQAGSLYALKEKDGGLLWKNLDGLGFSSGATYANGILYINCDDGNLYMLDAATGNIISKNLIYANGAIPTVANGNVFPGGGGSNFFYAFDAISGSAVWRFPLNSITTSKPLVIDANGNVN
ncbi:MAG: PQQ-binding-like beta-propeller repeat protein [Mucilaginibacter sp.]|uniref:outer membrane protein assembly factor BamB family protein n=1 Tax=Mucilaginibacter sp. TaxID=1882438 RepID=UPI0031AF1948